MNERSTLIVAYFLALGLHTAFTVGLHEIGLDWTAAAIVVAGTTLFMKSK